MQASLKQKIAAVELTSPADGLVKTTIFLKVLIRCRLNNFKRNSQKITRFFILCIVYGLFLLFLHAFRHNDVVFVAT